MKRFIVVVILVLMFISIQTFPVKAYSEAEEAGKRAVCYIEQARNLATEGWDAIEVSGLYTRLYSSIIKAVEKKGEETGYEIAEINYSADRKYFSLKVKPTIYLIKKGDTLLDIARRYNVTINELLELNPEITNPDKIYSGNYLKIK